MRGISELSDSDIGPYQASNSNCADLADMPLSLTPVALVHAALLFEHTGLGRCLENALLLVATGGKLSVVLQELALSPCDPAEKKRQ